MFLLDTMIPSELRKGRLANAGVLAWNASHSPASHYLSVATILEMRRGALQVATKDPRQSAVLHRWIDQDILTIYAGRILDINLAIVERCAALQVPAARDTLDVFIAATALEYGFTLITRNERHFADIGLRLFNPFT